MLDYQNVTKHFSKQNQHITAVDHIDLNIKEVDIDNVDVSTAAAHWII